MTESKRLKKFVAGKNRVGARGRISNLKVGACESYLRFWVYSIYPECRKSSFLKQCRAMAPAPPLRGPWKKESSQILLRQFLTFLSVNLAIYRFATPSLQLKNQFHFMSRISFVQIYGL